MSQISFSFDGVKGDSLPDENWREELTKLAVEKGHSKVVVREWDRPERTYELRLEPVDENDLRDRMAKTLESTVMFIYGYCSETVLPDIVELLSEHSGKTRDDVWKNHFMHPRLREEMMERMKTNPKPHVECPECGKPVLLARLSEAVHKMIHQVLTPKEDRKFKATTWLSFFLASFRGGLATQVSDADKQAAESIYKEMTSIFEGWR